MNFSLTAEQQLIQASALDWLAAQYDFRQRHASVHRDGGSPAVWRAFAEMGWLGLPLPEEFAGSAGGLLEAGLLMQAFGRHLVVEPYHACVLQAARLLALAGTQAQQRRWLPGVVDGSHRLALAHAEPGDELPWQTRRCAAHRIEGGWRLEGTKQLVAGAPGAAALIVSACDAAGRGDGLLFLIDPRQPGVHLDPYDTTDGARAADLRIEGVNLAADALLDGRPGATTQLLHQVLAEGIVTQCWEAVGAMQAMLEQTTAYTQQRRQFGQPLSGFQAVQHGLAEMAVHCVEAQAACELATLRIVRDPGTAMTAASMAKNKISRAARHVSQQAVQFHGAMGVCEELSVASTFRMLLAWSHKDGDGAAHGLQLGNELLCSRAYAHSQVLGELAATH